MPTRTKYHVVIADDYENEHLRPLLERAFMEGLKTEAEALGLEVRRLELTTGWSPSRTVLSDEGRQIKVYLLVATVDYLPAPGPNPWFQKKDPYYPLNWTPRKGYHK